LDGAARGDAVAVLLLERLHLRVDLVLRRGRGERVGGTLGAVLGLLGALHAAALGVWGGVRISHSHTFPVPGSITKHCFPLSGKKLCSAPHGRVEEVTPPPPVALEAHPERLGDLGRGIL